MATLQELRDAIDTAIMFNSQVDESSEVVLVSDPDGQAMEPGLYGIALAEPGGHGLVAGLLGNLGRPEEI